MCSPNGTGIQAPRLPNWNYSGTHPSYVDSVRGAGNCATKPPGHNAADTDGPRRWWNGTDMQELVSCQPPFAQPDVNFIDGVATRRCKTLMAVDDSLGGWAPMQTHSTLNRRTQPSARAKVALVHGGGTELLRTTVARMQCCVLDSQ